GPLSIQGRPPIGTPDRPPVVEYRMVTPGYFEAMQIPLHRGVTFGEREKERDRPVVIINETMARQFWPNDDPIGARVQLGADPTSIVREIVGVVGDVRSQALSQGPAPETFIPYAQRPLAAMSIAIRTAGDPSLLMPMVRQRIAAIDP